MRIKVVLATVAVAAVSLVPAASAERAEPSAVPKKTVQVRDYFFASGGKVLSLDNRLTVRPDTYILWVWPHVGGDLHDVKLVRRPAGVKRFHSELAASDYRYRRKLTKVGRYRMICTLHPDQMVMNVRVRR
jgi:plastocyanin